MHVCIYTCIFQMCLFSEVWHYRRFFTMLLIVCDYLRKTIFVFTKMLQLIIWDSSVSYCSIFTFIWKIKIWLSSWISSEISYSSMASFIWFCFSCVCYALPLYLSLFNILFQRTLLTGISFLFSLLPNFIWLQLCIVLEFTFLISSFFWIM